MKNSPWLYRFLFWLLSIFFKVGSGGAGSAQKRGQGYCSECPNRLDGACLALSSFSPVSLQNSKQGAIPVLYLCLAKELDGISGKYFSSSCVITLPPKAARDPHVAQSLWNTTVRLTNLDKMD